ncbi:hypothetical protein PVK06_039193 [Gossypium arboreum]|uniref:DUF4283 domain-containing protein n=1 Tax=Gossypium arboreum TaxID=29729 RepID=A0ABR0N2V2_GOSAR|nr:hypothetical protein PVK06_039193 [Gossypium arboreum]
MEENFGNLNIDDDEEVLVRFAEEDEDVIEDYSWCLVGGTLAGISITDIGEKRILFRFYNQIDFKTVVEGMAWFFNRHLIIFHKMERGEDPL